MKRTVEIEDTLGERVQGAIDEVRELLEEYIRENEPDEAPDLYNDLDYSGEVRDIIYISVPIYTGEIEDTWFLHANKLEKAYENAGIGTNPRENNGMVAIYCYIEQQVADWYRLEADDMYDEIMEEVEKEEEAEQDLYLQDMARLDKAIGG